MRFTIYYKTQMGDRISLLKYADYEEAKAALNFLLAQNQRVFHLIDNDSETVLL